MRIKFFLYGLLPIVVCLLYVNKLLSLDTNLITVFNEGFYYLTIWKIKHGIINDSLSLWAFIVNTTCSEKITSSILNL